MQRIKAPVSLGQLVVIIDGDESTVLLARSGKKYHSSVNFACQNGHVYDMKYGCEEVRLSDRQWAWIEEIASAHNL